MSPLQNRLKRRRTRIYIHLNISAIMPLNCILSKENKIVIKVLRYFENECSENQLSIPLSQPVKKAAATTGVLKQNVNRIKWEVKNTGNVHSPSKQRHIGKLIYSSTNLDDFDLCVTRQIISKFYVGN
ncbi:hypothetical protein HNY73_010424 [Argiope bruennichi]|uniref:Uncharacterized protein n=1 Tax=Argiope bruennichi TaxID=94029 RepID=A0A8T0F3D1_ARGBR|nr:hypothetical protein HNY73_010424 [Argiope bruennichi]